MSSSLRKVVQTLASRTIRLLLAVVTGVMIARTLQAEGRGAYAIISTTAGMAIVLGHFSVDQTQLLLWKDRTLRTRLTANSLILGLLLGAGTALIGTALTLFGVMPTASPLLLLSLCAVPFGIAVTNLRGIALLNEKVGVVNAGMVAAALTQCLPVIALAMMGNLTVTNVILCWTISIAIPFLFLVRALRPPIPMTELRLAGRQLALGSRYHIALVASYFLLTIDVLLLGALDSTAAVGIYTVATTVLYLTRIPAEAITQIALPRQAVGDLSDAGQVTARTLRLTLLVSAVFIGLLAAASPVLVPAVYGPSFTGSVLPLLVLAPGIVALNLIKPVEQYLVRLSRPITMGFVAVGALAANILLNLVLIPRWGVGGAALASTISYISVACLELAWFARSAALPMSALLPRMAELRTVLSSVPGVGVTLRSRRRAAQGAE